jgi:glycerol-3-phosphate dehydrogenase
MAEDTLEVVTDRLDDLPRSARKCRTRSLPLRGADGAQLDAEDHLSRRYGSEARVVAAIVEADRSLGEPLVPGLPYLRAEAVYAARHEMARSVDDVLARRTRARLQARDASAAVADAVAALLAPELGWTAEEAANQAAAYVALVDAERQAGDLPVTAPLPG